jgi:hypothetical protein
MRCTVNDPETALARLLQQRSIAAPLSGTTVDATSDKDWLPFAEIRKTFPLRRRANQDDVALKLILIGNALGRSVTRCTGHTRTPGGKAKSNLLTRTASTIIAS